MKFFTQAALVFSFAAVCTSALSQSAPERKRPAEQTSFPVRITGKIIDSQNKQPVEYATVAAFRSSDSTVAGGVSTNQKGEFLLELKGYGEYFLKVDFIGYASKTLPGISFAESRPFLNLGSVSLVSSVKHLSEVEVKGEKNQVQLSLDKKVYNAGKDLASSGGSATQVLQNVPSVTVDMDGTVNLRGSSNVRVFVDGKPSNITGSSRAAILEQIPASSIESIEVITNPSARYDAEGMAGIINIVLKKQRKRGFNGLVNLNAGTGDKYSGSANVNYNIGKLNFFGSYDGRSFRFINSSGSERRFNGSSDSVFYMNQSQKGRFKSVSQSARAGFDYNPDEKSSLTLSSLYRRGTNDSYSAADYTVLNNERVLLRPFVRTTNNGDSDFGGDVSLNYRRSFSRKGQTLTADIIYSGSDETSASGINTYNYNADYTPAASSPFLQQTRNKEKQNTYTLQADYTQPLSDDTKVETGYKSSLRGIDVDFHFLDFDTAAGGFRDNPGISNHFVYHEQVHAGYGTYSSKLGKFTYQAGLRAEQTLIQSELITTGEKNDSGYFSLFPSLFINRELGSNNKLQVSYSRRINRPNFHLLNPFADYTDPLNIRAGNPFLRPEFTDSYELSHIKLWNKTTLNSSLYYRQVHDLIRRVISVNGQGASRVVFQNLASGETFGLEMTLNTQLFSWWRMNASGNYFRNIVKGGPQLGNTDIYSWFGKMNSNFTLWKGIDFQVMLNYRGPMASPQGRIREMYFADFGFRKDVLKGKGTVTARVSDVFNTMRFAFDSEGTNFDMTSRYKHETRVVYVGFTYKINNYKLRERKRSGSPTQGGGMEDFGDF
jgi:outer membrane receptor protein involved in Fe transport